MTVMSYSHNICVHLESPDSGDGTTWEKKVRITEAEMDELCQPRHERYRNDER